MINEDIKAAEQNMAGMINNIARQIEADTGLRISLITVQREWVTTENQSGEEFVVSVSLGVRNEIS